MNYGYVKVAAAIPGVRVADCQYNALQIIQQMKEADSKGVEIIIFPELSITAYTCGDLFSQQLLLDEALAALLKVTDASRQNQLVSIIGILVEINGALLNCAAVIQNGRILGIVPKIYLPNYKEFYEMRWFASGKHYQTTINLGEQKNIPVSPYLIFETGQYRFGIEI